MFLSVLCLLAAAALEAATPLPLAPAPGAPAASAIVIAGQPLRLDAAGRGQIPADASPVSEKLRFYRVSPASGSEQILYYPSDHALASWSLEDVRTSAGATVVIKDSEEGWENAHDHPAPLETAGDGRRVRFAIAPGTWDVAVVVPGYAPAFVLGLDVYDDDETLAVAAVKLARAGRVTARILDARTGKPPDRWEAFVSGAGADADTEETKFFAGRPISKGTPALDFASLPVGGWEVRVVAPGRSEPHVAARVPNAGALVELGDVYVTDFGKLRVVLEFPDEVPGGTFDVQVLRPGAESEDEAVLLASRKAKARRDATLDFDGIEPGEVRVEAFNVDESISQHATAVIEPDRIAQARVVFRRVTLHGTVRRGDRIVTGAQLQAKTTSGPVAMEGLVPAVSDELGMYAFELWGGSDSLTVRTRPPDQKIGYTELVAVDPDASDVLHDVELPAGEIRGVVRDASTGLAIAGADVRIATAGPEDDAKEPAYLLGASTDAEGRFRLADLEENEEVDLEVTHDGYTPVRQYSIRPRPGGSPLDVRLEPGIRLSGRVVDEWGVPLPGVTVGLDVVNGQDFARTATTGRDGLYAFTGVADGSHVLGVFGCGRTIVLRRFSVDAFVQDEGESHTENVQVPREGSPLDVRIEKSDGTEANAVVRFEINGIPLPLNDWYEAAKRCGIYDEIGWSRMILHGFPRGTITAFSPSSPVVYGTFDNDGLQSTWTIRLPDSDQRLEAEGRPSAR